VQDIEIWTRLDEPDKRLFIEEQMALWQNGPLFTCREGHATGSTTNTFIECWGTPCVDDGNCNTAIGEYCQRPLEAYQDASCQICQGGCSCIVGQCLQGPAAPATP
jgi:hypothetical protein